jgi:hypothetical protein
MSLTPEDLQTIKEIVREVVAESARAVKAELVKELFGEKLPQVPRTPDGKKRLPFNKAEFRALVRRAEETNSREDKKAVARYTETHTMPE